MTKPVTESQVQDLFAVLCAQADRSGLLGFAPAKQVRLLPEQAAYLQERIQHLGPLDEITAISFGLFYREHEIHAVPAGWRAHAELDDPWNEYARAYQELNRTLNGMAAALAEEFGGVGEEAKPESLTGKVRLFGDFFPHCVSHRAFAEAAGLGWRGRHSLLVTPEVGPALRFSTVFVRGALPTTRRDLAGCGTCGACLEICPILRKGGEHRQLCHRRLEAMRLRQAVCGICVRVCWEQVTRGSMPA